LRFVRNKIHGNYCAGKSGARPKQAVFDVNPLLRRTWPGASIRITGWAALAAAGRWHASSLATASTASKKGGEARRRGGGTTARAEVRDPWLVIF